MNPDALTQLRDVKPPVAYPSFLMAIVITLMLIAILAAVFLLWQRMRRLSNERARVKKSPWENSLDQLAMLDKEGLIGQKQFNLYYSRLSDIVRRYIEERFSIKAAEMTTEEFLHHLQGSSDLFPDQKQALKKFLESCDLVKFAKFNPDPSEAKQSLELAVAFIRETTPKEIAV